VRPALLALFSVLWSLSWSCPAAAGDDVLHEGLVVEYRAREGAGGRVVAIAPRPAFSSFAGAGAGAGGAAEGTPHPRLAAGPFAAEWSGLIEIEEEDGPLTFSAHVAGEVEVTAGAETVLRARSTDPARLVRGRAGVRVAAGSLPFRAVFRSLPGVPARLQLWWEGESFAAEPLSPFRLRHRAADEPPELAEESRRERGRRLSASLGCARCHADAFPPGHEAPPGPSLADLAARLDAPWIARWLEDPRRIKPHARMPVLFAPGREGRLERILIARRLAPASPRVEGAGRAAPPPGDHRLGKRRFHSLGCAACHFLPELEPERQPDLDRIALEALSARLPEPHLARFLRDPRSRFPDGRMPSLRLDEAEARDLAAYLLLWGESAPAAAAAPQVARDAADTEGPVSEEDLDAFARVLGAREQGQAADELIRRKGCARCHEGLGEPPPGSIPIRARDAGCLGVATLPRFSLDDAERAALAAHLAAAGEERHAAPYVSALRLLERRRCDQCHAHAGLGPSPLEEVGASLGGSNLERVPYLRVPRLLDPLEKHTRAYLLAALTDGPRGVRGAAYTYRMPSFGDEAEALARALAARDGADPEAAEAEAAEPEAAGARDPTLQSLGPALAGFEGYSCISCHLWKGKLYHEPDPGAIGPELTTAATRLRRSWFERWLENPARFQPGTPMPQVFPARGEPAPLRGILEGDAERQRDALWEFFALGAAAADPEPLPPIPIPPPEDGSARVAQIPVRLPGGEEVESITIQTGAGDILVIDVADGTPRALLAGASLLRRAAGRVRSYTVEGEPVRAAWEPIIAGALLGYERRRDGVRFRWRTAGGVEAQTLRFAGRALIHGRGDKETVLPLPPARRPPEAPRRAVTPGEPREGSLERPGYRALAYPRPKLPDGEDLLMPAAVAADPRDGRVFVASLKLGQIFLVDDPHGDGREARYVDWTGGLFQDALSMHADPGALWVLHRRNLTCVTDTDGDGLAERFERALALPHGIADDYDYAYGLVRDADGAFVFGYAPYAHRKLSGSGGAVRVRPGAAYEPVEIASGLRNPVGWCAGPEGEVFATDNQGEWVATNKLSHVEGGRYHGFPNPERPEHHGKPRARPAVWVPYDWAHSLNGVTFERTGGKFGPFAGQFFIAELMFGGAIIRASLEKVGGEWQGACFPFWEKGLLGPLALAFDPRGRLWVGSITEPGWMAQPDRGGLFRIDYTGEVPFEILSIHARPRGFRVAVTRALDPRTATAAAFTVERWRYEHTGAYGSPEYDRVRLEVRGARVTAEALAVDLDLERLEADRVYLVSAPGIRSAAGEPLVHAAGAYTLNRIP
jgi:hypothetical protein